MLNFLSGKMGGMAARGLGGGQAAGGFMGRLQQGLQNPQFRQGMAGMGAQMMGLDPALGQMAAQGIQQRRFGQALAQGIPPIQRQQIDPRQFMPQQRPRFDLTQLQRLPIQQPMTGVIRNPTY